jgi:hypothetical protein
MTIVLDQSDHRGIDMTVLQQIKEMQTETTPKQPVESPTRVSAVVEAAYILEAVRK